MGSLTGGIRPREPGSDISCQASLKTARAAKAARAVFAEREI